MTKEVEILLEKAFNLQKEERFDEALKILEKLFKTQPNSLQVKKSFINALFTYGGYLNDEYTLQYEKAKEMFKRILDIDPMNYRAQYNLGIANFNLDEIEKAKECYEEAIRIKPDYKHCFYNLGLVYERVGDLQEALKFYEKALEIDPRFPYAVNARNQILANLDELKKSEMSSTQQRNLSQLKSLLEMSKRIKIDMIQTVLNLPKDELFDLLIDWGKKFQIEIDGEFLNINKETLPHLIKYLDEKYA
ncbi:MAG: tetratricopeptide repeat protein [Promethearchaeota archaeon]